MRQSTLRTVGLATALLAPAWSAACDDASPQRLVRGGVARLAVGAPLPRMQDPVHLRRAMVEEQIVARGVTDPEVLEAMRTVPRHEFVDRRYRSEAYEDRPLPIGHGQTISQPFIVAFMTEQLQVGPRDTVLEVGTGSGYQAAVLAEIVARVHTIEIFQALASSAEARLDRLGHGNVEVRHGDGWFGWPEQAPFDAIIVTAASGQIPPPLVEQLKPGGRMAIPVGSVYGVQNLVLVRKAEDGSITTRSLMPVSFVPLLRGER